MASELSLGSLCIPSDEIVMRIIEGDIVIAPLAAGIGDMDDELYTLNETGRAIWEKLDGQRSVSQVAAELALEHEADEGVLERDVAGLVGELLSRRMLVDIAHT